MPDCWSMSKIARAALMLTLALLQWEGTARADAVMPVEFACPDGSSARPSHSGGYCSPVYRAGECSTSTDCQEGEQCLEVSRCLWLRKLQYRMGEYTEHQMVFPGEDGACGSGECTTMQVCTVASSVSKDACGAPASPTPEATQPVGPITPIVPEEPAADKDQIAVSEEDSGCATVAAGLSSSMAGLLGLVVLCRRRDERVES